MPLSLMHRQYIPSARMVIFFLLLLLATGVARAATFGVTTPGQQTLTNRFLPYAGSGTQLIGNSPAWRDSAGVLGINNYLEGLETLTPAAAVNLNFSTWRTKRITLNQNTVFTAINIPSASTNVQTMLLEVIGDGAFTVSFANVTWQTPEITTPEAGVVTLYALRGDSGAVKGYTQAVTATGIGPLTVGYVPLADATNNVTDSGLFQISTNRIGFSSTNQFFYTHEPDFTTAVGTDAYSSTATATTAFGFNALKLGLSNAHDDSAFGAFAGANLTSGAENSLFGRDAGLGITTENGNSYFGYAAGGGLTGGYNTIVGNGSGSAAGAVTNVIVLGQGIQPLVNNATYIGNTNTTAAYVIASGYTGTGANFLSDDGTYKAAGGGSVTTINPTDGYLPYRSNATTFADTILSQSGTNVIILRNTGPTEPHFDLGSANTNNASAFLAFQLSDSDGITDAARVNGSKGSGWDAGTPASRNGHFSVNVLSTNAYPLRFDLDGNDGGAYFYDRAGNLSGLIGGASGYTGAGTLFLSDDGTYKAAGGGSPLWSSSSGNLTPSPAVDVVSIESQSANNSTNVALRAGSSTDWTAGATLQKWFNGLTNLASLSLLGTAGDGVRVKLGENSTVNTLYLDAQSDYAEVYSVGSSPNQFDLFSDSTAVYLYLGAASAQKTLLQPTRAAGLTPYFFDTSITHTSNNLVEVANNGTNKMTVDYLGNVTANGLAVNNAITFGLPALTYAATTDLDMSGANYTTLALTGDVIFTTSNRSAGRSKVIFIKSDGSARGFTFPSWDWAGGAAPAGIAANKTAILSLFCIDGTDANMVATYTVEDAVVGDVSGPASSTDNALARFDLATGKVIQNSSGATLSDNMALTLAGATITTSEPVLNLSQTWNAVGTTFTGVKINITNSASASGSLLADFQVGGTSLSAISKAGVFYAPLGSVSAPGLSFIGGNTTYGMYKGSGLLGLSAGGREGLRINTDSATDPGTYASVMAGTNTVRARIGGTLTVNTTQVGNITTGEDDLMTYSVGANVLGLNADHLRIVCSGSFAANGNNKTLKAYFGATQLFTTGVVAFNAGDWTMQIEIIRISNTSQISNVTFQSSNTSLTSSAAVTTSAETLSGAVTFKCTGEATATDDITQKTELVYYGKGQ